MNAIQTNPAAQLLASLQALVAQYGKLQLLVALPAVLFRKDKAPRPPDVHHLPAHLQRDIGLIDAQAIRRKD